MKTTAILQSLYEPTSYRKIIVLFVACLTALVVSFILIIGGASWGLLIGMPAAAFGGGWFAYMYNYEVKH